MKKRALAILLSAAVASCSDSTSPPPPPAGPSADMTVEYVAGGQATFTVDALWVGRGPVVLAPGDTTWCAGINVVGSTPDGPYDPERPQLRNPNAGFCADSAKDFPIEFNETLGGGLEDHGNSSVGGYVADSGTIHVEPLGGGYAQIDFDGWYRPWDAPSSPFVFRIVGRLVAADTVPVPPNPRMQPTNARGPDLR
jgi:hypothetical protein